MSLSLSRNPLERKEQLTTILLKLRPALTVPQGFWRTYSDMLRTVEDFELAIEKGLLYENGTAASAVCAE